MTFVLISPGTGTFYCGSCIRDDGLARAIRRAGRDVLVVPLYLPIVTDAPHAAERAPIRFGGINVYLQQKSALFRHTPAWLDRLLDAGPLLRAAAHRAGMTNAHDLGALTVSMLRGEDGNQRKELDKLLAFLASRRPKPTIVCLSNALLVGLVHRLREALDVPVVLTLQGEDAFLDSLPEPHRSAAWAEVSRRTQEADGLVAVSRYYGETMQRRLGFDAAKLRVVHNGIDLEGFRPADADPDPPVVGYLARMCEAKGLGTLAEAFIELKRRPGMSRARLSVAGSVAPGDEPYAAEIERRLHHAGLGADVSFRPNLSLAEKQAFLRSLSVFCVPAMYGESFGLYLLEAWASGVPVVQPRVASFPELLADTGGGLLTETGEPAELAESLASILTNPAERRRLGRLGREAVLSRFGVDRMAHGILSLVDELDRRDRPPRDA